MAFGKGAAQANAAGPIAEASRYFPIERTVRPLAALARHRRQAMPDVKTMEARPRHLRSLPVLFQLDIPQAKENGHGNGESDPQEADFNPYHGPASSARPSVVSLSLTCVAKF
jgi:hypothetical protein